MLSSAVAAAGIVSCSALAVGGGEDHRHGGAREPADERAVVAHGGTGSSAAIVSDAPGRPFASAPVSARRRERVLRGGGPRPILSMADRASFRRLSGSLLGAHGLAVAGVGRGLGVERVGSLQSVIAWSTAKVPIAMAAIDAGVARTSDLTAAITASDNAAAMRLWSSLGSPTAAAGAADAQLRRGGDQRTEIEARVLRAGYTPFGQTSWALVDQVRFTAAMPCSPAGPQVLGLMGKVVSSQRWGLGAAGVPAQLKGGWGPGIKPGARGGHLDRQMGIVTIRGTPLAVGIASRPADATHASGARSLTAIARWLVTHADVSAQPADASCETAPTTLSAI